MKHKNLQLGIPLIFLALAFLPAFAGEVLDRIVATVNNRVILQSDWTLELSYQAFLEGRSTADLSPQERREALDHLVDQELIRQQMPTTEFQHVSPAEVQGRLTEIRRQKAANSSEAEWLATLARAGLNESELREKIASEIDQMRAVEARLRPTVQVDARSVEVYYNEKFIPELLRAGAKRVPMEQVAAQIRELLAQQRMNEFLLSWLHSLRNESKIHTAFDSSPPGGGGS
jgi:hypothetical protein